MLANHVLSNMRIRKGEQRRDALLARLNVDTDQLLGEQKNKMSSWENVFDLQKKLHDSFKNRKRLGKQAARCMFHIRYIQDI